MNNAEILALAHECNCSDNSTNLLNFANQLLMRFTLAAIAQQGLATNEDSATTPAPAILA